MRMHKGVTVVQNRDAITPSRMQMLIAVKMIDGNIKLLYFIHNAANHSFIEGSIMSYMKESLHLGIVYVSL